MNDPADGAQEGMELLFGSESELTNDELEADLNDHESGHQAFKRKPAEGIARALIGRSETAGQCPLA